MKYKQLGITDIKVSEVCLGTMTWGVQNNQDEAHQQINYALSQGVNFIDTAEMYPIPPSAETYGRTEKIIGHWLAANTNQREKIVLASKAAGDGVPWIRSADKITGEWVKRSLDASLKRLQTDYIDLYQLHWPNRTSPHFSKHWPAMLDYQSMDAGQQRDEMLDILQSLDGCITAGKIRHCGLSNETPWGIKEYVQLAKEHNLPKMTSIQNEFNLLHLVDSPHVIESCVLDEVSYLPWSPLAGGALSGKYRHDTRPEGCRWTMQQRKGLFRDTPLVMLAIDAFAEVAERHGLSVAQLALAWVYQFPGVTSTIIGATSIPQLKENIDAHGVSLSSEAIGDILAVIKRYPVPF